MISSINNTDDYSEHSEVEVAMIDALAAKETMFKVVEGNNNELSCSPYWPMTIIHKANFSLSKEDVVMTGDDNKLGERSFEYGASWVEHYYTSLITLCKEQDRMELVKMLYNWYIAQFSVDYINDVAAVSKEQFLETSNLLKPRNDNTCTALHKHRFSEQLEECRDLMKEHDKMLYSLPTKTAQKIFEALNDFYMAVAQQCDAQQKGQMIEDDDPLNSMSMADYMNYRTINAGGLMGFVRQTYLISLLNDKSNSTFPSTNEMQHVSYLVGKNIALINDLYGLRKDQVSGEPNIILPKHARKTGNSSSKLNDSMSLEPSIAWAFEEIKQTVRDITLYYEEHPDSLITKYDIALSCVSGNHGFHESSKRYELPEGFSWTETENICG